MFTRFKDVQSEASGHEAKSSPLTTGKPLKVKARTINPMSWHAQGLKIIVMIYHDAHDATAASAHDMKEEEKDD